MISNQSVAPEYSARRAPTGRCHRKCCWTPYGHRDAPYCVCHLPDDPPAPATPEEIAERVKHLNTRHTPAEPRCAESTRLAHELVAKFLTPAAASRASGIPHSTLANYLNGRAGANPVNMQRLREAAS